MLISDLLLHARADKKLPEAELLIAYILGKSMEWVLGHPEWEVSESEVAKFHGLWVRLLDEEPLAYLVKNKEFYGLNFYVDERVLVPRPETEAIVDIIDGLTAGDFLNKKNVQVVDVGTGCGAVACALSIKNPKSKICATEVSKDACEVARKNIDTLGADVELFCGNLLESIKDRRFDIIAANLPYIGREKYNYVAGNVVKYEPSLALYGGDDGLRLYDEMFRQILEFGMKPSYIVGEFGFLQKEELEKMIMEYFSSARLEFKKDLSGLDRDFIIKISAKDH